MSDTTPAMIPFDTLVTVRVKGQSKRLSRVRLAALTEAQAASKNAQEKGLTPENTVRVLTGKRGRPFYLPMERISEVRVLADAN